MIRFTIYTYLFKPINEPQEPVASASELMSHRAWHSVMEFVQNDLYYPTFEDKLTFLVSRICTGHLFDDGNKRRGLQ